MDSLDLNLKGSFYAMNFIVAQITDLHISTRTNKNSKRLDDIIYFITHYPNIQCVLITGDLVDNGSDKLAYDYLCNYLNNLQVPYYLLGGNHDHFSNIQRVFPDHSYLYSATNHGDYCLDMKEIPFKLVALNTVIEDKSYGRIQEEQLTWFNSIHDESLYPILVMMHHPPFNKEALQTLLLKQVILDDAIWDALKFEGIEYWQNNSPQWKKVSLIMSSHYHLGINLKWYGQNLVVSPAVAPPFEPLVPQSTLLKELGVFIDVRPSLTLHHWQERQQTFTSEFLGID
jgi:3',5'-cyclic AMP phosphodiesterase CpdA